MIESPWFEKLGKNLHECFLEWSSHYTFKLGFPKEFILVSLTLCTG